MNGVFDRIAAGFLPDEAQLCELLLADADVWARIYRVAGALAGDVVYVRGIIEFSSHCRRACRYCGLNRTNRSLARYRMTPDEIVDLAVAGYDAGYKTVVLQSGEDAYFTAERLSDIVRRIKRARPVAVTLSAGEFSHDGYARMRDAGCDRYLLKHETADPALYQALHPDSSLEARLSCLRDLKSLGFETGGGFMVGLPGQTASTLARDLRTVASIPCDMAGVGPFIPHPDTPLKGSAPGSVELTKRCVALLRLLLPDANLPATTALGVLSGEGNADIFSCGANVIMKKLTPPNLIAKYSIYPADFGGMQGMLEERARLNQFLEGLGKRHD